MTKYEIIEALAKDRRVEHLVDRNTQEARLSPDDKADLIQMIYEILLEYDDAKIEELSQRGAEMNYFIIGIIRNLAFSKTSRFYYIFRKFRENSEEITDRDWIDE